MSKVTNCDLRKVIFNLEVTICDFKLGEMLAPNLVVAVCDLKDLYFEITICDFKFGKKLAPNIEVAKCDFKLSQIVISCFFMNAVCDLIDFFFVVTNCDLKDLFIFFDIKGWDIGLIFKHAVTNCECIFLLKIIFSIRPNCILNFLCWFFEGRIKIRRATFKLGGTGIYHFKHTGDA